MTRFDTRHRRPQGVEAPPIGHFNVVPSDADSDNFVTRPRCLWIGVGGNIVVVDDNDVALMYTVPDAYELLGQWKRVNATGTTATQIRGWY